MALTTVDSGLEMKSMDMVFRSGWMVPGLKAIGKLARQMVVGNLLIAMEMLSKGTGLMVDSMEMQPISMQKAQFIKEFLKMISKMVKAMKNGSMDPIMTANTKEATNTAKVAAHGKMVLLIKEHGNSIACKVRDSTNGRMEIHTKEAGTTTKCMGMECILGQMGGDTMANMKTI